MKTQGTFNIEIYVILFSHLFFIHIKQQCASISFLIKIKKYLTECMHCKKKTNVTECINIFNGVYETFS